MTFAHLHVHSDFSLLDGMSRITDLVETAEALGQPALALTDHGTMSGAIAFYSRAKESSVKPIIGLEAYTTADRHEKGEYYHLTLLAENAVGYHNLIRLSTAGYLDGFYRKPRVDHELLDRYSEGVICLSGCMACELSQAVLADDWAKELQVVRRHKDIFGDRYYLEIQDHHLPEDARLIEHTVRHAIRSDIPLVATNDAHYVRRDQAPIHEILLCVQTHTIMSNPKRMNMGPHEFYLKSYDEMNQLFGQYKGAMSNTLAIAERCNLELDFGRPHLPAFATPEGMSSSAYLRQLVEEGAAARYETISDAVFLRIKYELEIIEATGFADYFLLVWDVVRFARERGILVGPGRGSGAGAIVAYCLFITGVDPLAYNLSFERFLNPERISMPDMDLDFADTRRGEVVDYVTNKYGVEHVAGIITTGTIGIRSGVRDVSRALELPLARADELAKMVPFMAKNVTQAIAEAPELGYEIETDEQAKKVFGIVGELTGVARHASKHAAGIVISRDTLVEHVPLATNKGETITQYDMVSIDALGLLKMDFLGLRTLSVIDLACRLIGQRTGTPLDPEDIPLDHPAIYHLLSSGNTFGVFQVDGYGMRKLLRELRPEHIGHISAVIALYRPGPMQYLDDFVSRRHELAAVTYRHPVLEAVLADTYGIIVYQEQVMEIAVKLAGYTMGQADLLRKAMGKKKPEIMAKERQNFVDRCVGQGVASRTAAAIFDDIEPFAGYAFNRAHATSYAFLTARTAWLKAQHPKEFMAALLTCESSHVDKVREAVAECRRLNITMLDPDVNLSGVEFRPETGGIRYGLASLPNIGEEACRAIVNERNNGPFASPLDFCCRLGGDVVNKRVLEALVQCRAMDSLMDRAELRERLGEIMAFGQAMHKARASGQLPLLDAEPRITLTEVEPEKKAERVIVIELDDDDIEQTVGIMQIAARYPGDDEVVVRLAGVATSTGVRAGYCPQMETDLTAALAS